MSDYNLPRLESFTKKKDGENEDDNGGIVDNKPMLSAVFVEEEKEVSVLSSFVLPNAVADEEAATGGEAAVVKRKEKKSLQDHSTREYIFVVILGLTMSFIAGYSNGVCLSGYIHVDTRESIMSVAGVTGLYTLSAIALGENDMEEYSFEVATILSVMVGACISSLLNPRPIAFHLSPRYGPTFLLGCVFSAAGAVAAVHNQKREFYLTAIANGIMNGISSMYTANLIRTTHLTGTTTDIGLFVGQFFRGNRINLWKLYILAGLATFFWVGSLVGYEVSKVARNDSLILNASFFGVLGCSIILYFMFFSENKLSFLDVIVGNESKCCDHLQFEKDTNSTTGNKKLSMYDNRNNQSVRDIFFQNYDDYDNGNNNNNNNDDGENETNKNMLMVTEQELLEILDKIVCSEGNETDDDDDHGPGRSNISINHRQQQQDQFLELIRLKSKVNKLKSKQAKQQQQQQQQGRHSTVNSNCNTTNGNLNSGSRIRTARQSINMIQHTSILEIEATGYHLKSN